MQSLAIGSLAPVSTRSYERVFFIAARLIAGDVLRIVDAQGRTWVAQADRLVVTRPGSQRDGLEFHGDAFEVAKRLARIVPQGDASPAL